MSKAPKIDAVVFDLDGVYFEQGTPQFIKALSSKYDLHEDAIKAVYFKSPQMRDYKLGKISGAAFWNYAIQTWNINATMQEILAILVASYAENPKTVALIHELRSKGIKTAACTNNFKERIEGLNRCFGFKKNFDVFVASYEEGVAKPDAGIFMDLARKLKLAPENIIMSDDDAKNVEALKGLGFQAFLYEGFEDFRKRVL